MSNDPIADAYYAASETNRIFEEARREGIRIIVRTEVREILKSKFFYNIVRKEIEKDMEKRG
jgi:hypothetical protein